MKRFLIIVFLLMFSSGFAVAKDTKVFGIKTLESVFEYVDSLSDSEPHAETLGRKYNQIWITPPKLNSSFEDYQLIYDNKTKVVQGMIGIGEIFEFDYCLGQMEAWKPRLEKRFSTNLEKFEQNHDGMMTVAAGSFVMDGEQYIDIRCNQYSNGAIWLIFLWRTAALEEAIVEYYADF
jgi:hypothetical protein